MSECGEDESLNRSGGHTAGAISADAGIPLVPVVPIRDVGVVIVAGGSGTRAGVGELKQLRWVAGKPMLLHSVQTFQARNDVAMVVAVLPKRYAGDPPPWLFQSDLERLLVSTGGRERTDSVRNGIEDLPPEVRIVVIHDAARPLVTEATIDAVIRAAREGHGAVAALPELDTLKRVADDGSITDTIDRTGLWRAQTPQAFPREMIERAHAAARADLVTTTDDSALCERLGMRVVVVPGSERAMKVTVEDDFARADALSLLPQ